MIEPSKSEVAAFDADGTVPARRAVSVVLNRAENSKFKAVV